MMPDQKPFPPFRPPPAGLPARRALALSLPRRAANGDHGQVANSGRGTTLYSGSEMALQRKLEARINSHSPFTHPAPAPMANLSVADRARLMELDRSLRVRHEELDARENALDELQARMTERAREISELENLLLARERVLMAQRKAPTLAPFAASAEETTALEELRATLDAQEAALAEGRAAFKERESFIERSEATLLEKVAAQQEHEIMLEQRYEDLRRAEHDFRNRLAQIDPQVAAELQAEKARKRDEFNE
jgi:hypothetical protein